MRLGSFLLATLLLALPVVADASDTTEESEETTKARLIEHLDGIDAMEARVNAVRLQVRTLPSAADLDREGVGKVQTAAWEARALVPAATATAEGFRDAWPELQKTLERFLSKSDAYRKTGEVEESLGNIAGAAKAIERDLNARASDYAHSLDLANLKSSLELMDSAPGGAQSVHAKNAGQQADDLEIAAHAILAIYPAEPQPGTAPLLPMDERQQGWSKAAKEALPVAADGRARAEKKLAELAAAARARIAGARFPRPNLSGGAWDGLADQVAGLVATAWNEPRQDILRVGIDSDWQERSEWVAHRGSWSWERYRFFWVYTAVALDGGRCRVYALTFRQDRTSSGWSALHLWGVGHSYEMLPENVSL